MKVPRNSKLLFYAQLLKSPILPTKFYLYIIKKIQTAELIKWLLSHLGYFLIDIN